MLMFTLSMPSNNSWNRKWSGDGRMYARVRKEPRDRARTDEILNQGSFHYGFGDGWCACVSVEQIDSKKAASVRRKSLGFCGYDWMIDEIIQLGRIKTLAERQETLPVAEHAP